MALPFSRSPKYMNFERSCDDIKVVCDQSKKTPTHLFPIS
jgi:hypothetical protein